MVDSRLNIMALISPPAELFDSFSQPASPATPVSRMSRLKSIMGPAMASTSTLPSPESPALSTFELAKRFRAWSPDLTDEGRPASPNPDPILYPGRRQSAEYQPLFAAELNQTTRLQSLPAVFSQGNERSGGWSDPESPHHTATISVESPPASETDDHARIAEAQRIIKDALIEGHYKTSPLRQYIQPKSRATPYSKPKSMVMPPTRDEYGTILDVALQSMVLKDYNLSPPAYLKRLLDENEENRNANKRIRSNANRPAILRPTENQPSTLVLDRIQHVPANSRKAHPPKPRKVVKKQAADIAGTPEPTKHKRASVKKTKAVFHFNDIPDYAPPLSTIPADKTFRVTWTGQSLDLSDDPDKHLLHPAEVSLASKLRFHCDQYLKTKRRVFVGRVNNLIKHPNKQFCKTDAQQVGGVDVNKLSQLWEAYNSIGWFDSAHFKGHVAAIRNAEQVYDPKNTKWVDRKELLGF